jgi:hypothetical protein
MRLLLVETALHVEAEHNISTKVDSRTLGMLYFDSISLWQKSTCPLQNFHGWAAFIEIQASASGL